MRVVDLADQLDAALESARDVPRLTLLHPELSLDDGYAVQDELRRRREASGEVVSGLKLGLTSVAKQQQMGVDEPIFGFLLESDRLRHDATADLRTLIHPRVEPELAIRVGRELGSLRIGAEELADAVDGVASALEVIDSRYENFDFFLPDVVADNTSAGRWAVGAWSAVTPVDLATLEFTFTLDCNDERGSAEATMGGPLAALASLVDFCNRRGRRIDEGSVVLTGGLTAARAVAPGSIARCQFDRLEPVTIHFE